MPERLKLYMEDPSPDEVDVAVAGAFVSSIAHALGWPQLAGLRVVSVVDIGATTDGRPPAGALVAPRACHGAFDRNMPDRIFVEKSVLSGSSIPLLIEVIAHELAHAASFTAAPGSSTNLLPDDHDLVYAIGAAVGAVGDVDHLDRLTAPGHPQRQLFLAIRSAAIDRVRREWLPIARARVKAELAGPSQRHLGTGSRIGSTPRPLWNSTAADRDFSAALDGIGRTVERIKRAYGVRP